MGRAIEDLETILATFFGPPVKPAGKPLPRKLKKNPSVKYLGGIKNDQSLFLMHLNTGEFYGALWPWRRDKGKIEIHIGYCSDWITDEDYDQIDTLVKRSLSKSAFEQMDTAVGGADPRHQPAVLSANVGDGAIELHAADYRQRPGRTSFHRRWRLDCRPDGKPVGTVGRIPNYKLGQTLPLKLHRRTTLKRMKSSSR